jgi:hypothetical protein
MGRRGIRKRLQAAQFLDVSSLIFLNSQSIRECGAYTGYNFHKACRKNQDTASIQMKATAWMCAVHFTAISKHRATL